ncbi:MAG: FAD-binding oxidoreductase [Pseudomonadota bacterium]
MSPELVAAFSAIVGERYAVTTDADKAPFLREWRDKFFGETPVVLRPGSIEEVSDIVTLAYRTKTPIVPQGGNTGAVGGQIPYEAGEEIVLSLTRLDRVRMVDPDANTITVDAGVPLQKIQEAADRAGRLFPLSLASEGTCQIGGNIATNAGGTAVLSYGNTRDLVLGLEVVLPDGRVWNGLRGLRKDNTGYDLKNLFIGSEGTLGIITGAVLKLFPRPETRATAFVSILSPTHAVSLLNRMKALAGPALTTFEILPRIAIEFCLTHVGGARDPLTTTSPWYCIVELSGSKDAALDDALMTGLEAAMTAGEATDAALAQNETQSADFWRLRHEISSIQKLEGGSIKHDVSVPVSKVPELLERGCEAVEAMIPGARPVPFGHLGDGNIHFNITQPLGADKATFLAQWDAVNALIHGIVQDLGGSIAAEHGIGRLKRDLMRDVKSDVELDLMKRIKLAIDPTGIMNPGKVLPD